MTSRQRRPTLGPRLAALALELTPQVFAAASLASGLLILASAVTPAFGDRLRLLSGLMTPLLIDLSHFAASVVGFLLVLLSAGLWRRRRGAYWAALLALLAGAVFSLTKGLDWEEAAVLLVVAGLLLPCRPAFQRRSRLVEPLRPAWLAVLAAAVLAMLWLGLFAYRDVAYTDELWWSFLTDREASGFLRAGAVLALLTLVVAGRSLLAAPGAASHGPAGPQALERARAVLEMATTGRPDGRLALLGDKALLFSPSGDSFLAYRVRGRRWIAMSEPVGRIEERLPLLWAFAEMADSYGGAAVFYAVSETLLPDLATLGLAVRKVGETAVIDTAAFSLEGKSRQNLRTAVNRAEREGARFRWLAAGEAVEHAAALKAVSDDWLDQHDSGEKAFSLGRFDIDYLASAPVATAWNGDELVAFASLTPSPDGATLAVDLMRHNGNAAPGLMDYLFIRAIQHARGLGMTGFDLGMAPLSGLDDRRLAPVFARVGALVFDEGGAVYGFQGLRSFKAKFGPDWRPVFIAAPASTPLALALLDVALLTSGGWLEMLGLRRGSNKPGLK